MLILAQILYFFAPKAPFDIFFSTKLDNLQRVSWMSYFYAPARLIWIKLDLRLLRYAFLKFQKISFSEIVTSSGQNFCNSLSNS